MRHIKHLILVSLLVVPAANAATVNVDPSTGPWLGYMNVFELPSNGGAFVFGSPWGIADLVAVFDDGANALTLKVNSILDPNPFWYTPAGGPGAAGNKVMEANLYQEYTDVYNGQTLIFEGVVSSNTFAASHAAKIFIKDFAPDYSSFNQTIIDIAPGPFSISLATDPGAGRHVQYGFQVTGPCVWISDADFFGNAMIRTIPEPASLGLLALTSLLALRRR